MSTALGSFLNSPGVTAEIDDAAGDRRAHVEGPADAPRIDLEELEPRLRALELRLRDVAIGLRLLDLALGADAVRREILLAGEGALRLRERAARAQIVRLRLNKVGRVHRQERLAATDRIAELDEEAHDLAGDGWGDLGQLRGLRFDHGGRREVAADTLARERRRA